MMNKIQLRFVFGDASSSNTHTLASYNDRPSPLIIYRISKIDFCLVKNKNFVGGDMLSRTTKGISHRLYQIRSIHKITLPQTKNEQRAKRQVGLQL